MYGRNQHDPKLTKTQCSQCGRFHQSDLMIERYDPNVLVVGWYGKPTASLKTFCNQVCEQKYFGENQ